MCIFQAQLTQSVIWVSLKRSLPPADLEYRQYQIGQWWWYQEQNKGQCLSPLVTAGIGINTYMFTCMYTLSTLNGWNFRCKTFFNHGIFRHFFWSKLIVKLWPSTKINNRHNIHNSLMIAYRDAHAVPEPYMQVQTMLQCKNNHVTHSVL